MWEGMVTESQGKMGKVWEIVYTPEWCRWGCGGGKVGIHPRGNVWVCLSQNCLLAMGWE